MIAPPARRVVILSGAGLSAASGVPTFRDANGLWEGYDVLDVATPQAWRRDRALVHRFYSERRVGAARAEPNAGHHALARLQRAWGDRVVLVTQNVDGLLQRAGCAEVIEMHGSLWTQQCEHDPMHPRVPAELGAPIGRCALCDGDLRPAIVWFGEIPHHLAMIDAAVRGCDLFLSVGTSGVVYPAAGYVQLARQIGARCVEINPKPSGGPFHQTIVEGAETALPRVVDAWLS